MVKHACRLLTKVIAGRNLTSILAESATITDFFGNAEYKVSFARRLRGERCRYRVCNNVNAILCQRTVRATAVRRGDRVFVQTFCGNLSAR
jgi:hypothetical protein